MRLLAICVTIFAALQVATPLSAQTMRQADGACGSSSVLGTSRMLEVGTRGGVEIGLKTYAQTLPLADGEVVLTFDDGPLTGVTNHVLDTLRAQCVKATFFLIGRNAQEHPALVRRELAEGHTVAHHSYSHPARTLRGLSEEAARAEIVKGVNAVQIAGGLSPYTDGRAETPFFRFPGFADTPATRQFLQSRQFAVFGADIWASDWNAMSPPTQLRLITARLEHQRRGIILFHDTRAQTAAMLPAFLSWLKAHNYRVVHLVPGGGPPAPMRPAPAGWTSETEAIVGGMLPVIRPASLRR